MRMEVKINLQGSEGLCMEVLVDILRILARDFTKISDEGFVVVVLFLILYVCMYVAPFHNIHKCYAKLRLIQGILCVHFFSIADAMKTLDTVHVDYKTNILFKFKMMSDRT